MPKLSFKTSRHDPGGEAEQGTVEVALDGFIDAANHRTFEKALEDARQLAARFLLLDFTSVHYINSTGISAVLREHEAYRQRGGLVCLAGVSRPVGLSMHLLGVTSVMPFCEDREAAEQTIRDFAAEKTSEALPTPSGGAAPPEGASRRSVVFRRQPGHRRDDARIVVITPSEGRFTRVLRRRFRYLNGGYHLLHDIHDALRRCDEIRPDLVVVDDRCDPNGEFVNRLKVQREKSLTSVIKIYAKDTDVQAAVEFKIWENDFLVDPFEVLEFFSLTEAELDRVPKDRRVFYQQVHFEFRTRPDNTEKAYQLSERILGSALDDGDARTAMFAAVKEGIDNAVRHGNLSAPEKTIDINFLVDHKKVTVLIEDQGKGFDVEYYLARVSGKEAFEEAKRKILDEGIRGGLGILLMSRCADRIEYHGAGNILRLEKNI